MKLSACRVLFLVLLIAGSNACAHALPDLIAVASAADAYASTEDFLAGSCAVEEGCTTAGRRRLLRFTAYVQNLGPDDLVLGSPGNNPLFEFHPCHGHYHFRDFLSCRLLTTTGVVVSAMKQSFCLADTTRHDSTASTTPLYNCLNQGIQAGWGDMYPGTLDCQYMDITDVSPGSYVLELHVNPSLLITEGNYANNVSTSPVTIEAFGPAPPNDNCTSAIQIQIEGVPLTGSTEAATNDGSACSSSIGMNDVWFRYVPQQSGQATVSLCGSSYDTILSVHSGCPGTVFNMIACNDDNTGGVCPEPHQSYLTIGVNAGTAYLIRVSGAINSNGNYRLTVTGPGQPAAVCEWQKY